MNKEGRQLNKDMAKSNRSTTPSGNADDRPLWRKQFPIDTVEDAARTRREFIGGLAVAGGAMACGQAALDRMSPPAKEGETEFHAHPPLVLDRKFSELRDGEAMLFHYPDHKSPALLVRLADTYVAFSQKCTHLACPVIPDTELQRFECPCHKGSFDMHTGTPIAGPPRIPLPQIKVNRDADGMLTATGIELA